MESTALIIHNFKEIRRRSIELWKALPAQYYHWKPDPSAMSASEMIRHVLAADYGWNIIISGGDVTKMKSPWEGKPFTNVEDEIAFAEPHRKSFFQTVERFSVDELENKKIIHPGNGKAKILGGYLLRIGYHEAVHAGNFIAYLREIGVERPQIWD